MQHRAIRLMASKLAVAGVIEGNLTDEGLAAMSDCQDMTTALARELTQGIEGEVEDLGAVFKRMALLKPARENVIDSAADVIAAIPDNFEAEDQPTPVVTAAQGAKENVRPKPPAGSGGLLALLHAPAPKRSQKKKASAIHENQMSLFDLLDIPA
jgi:hypothetical protein